MRRIADMNCAGGCGSFYAILISSPEFAGLSMVKQHKLVNDCLKEDIAGIHGLQVSYWFTHVQADMQLKTIAEKDE